MNDLPLETAAPVAQAQALTDPRAAPAGASVPTLRELLEDGFHLLILLRGGGVDSASEFNRRIDHFLADFERVARGFGKTAEATDQAKYAFCSLLDEIILASDSAVREEWERMPLQLRLFGEHLAGEAFFERLEVLRSDPEKHVEALEVFHVCLLLGFHGRYLLEGTEKLAYLTHRLGLEIRQVRGGKAEFAPDWQLPERFAPRARDELPIWLYFALLAGVAAALFLAYGALLDAQLAELLTA